MKIGIDARMYGTKQAGLGRYVQELVLGLEKEDSNNEYTVFLRQDNWDEYQPGANNFKKVLADVSWYSLAEQIRFNFIINKAELDLIHFPHWNVPFFYNRQFVVTIHDLIMYHHPRQEASTHGLFFYWFKDIIHRLVLRRAVKKARQIIVTSEFTKQDVNKTLGVPLKKMTVIYQAPFVSGKEEVESLSVGRQGKKEEVEKFGITKPYVLYVGNAYPHKNLEGLLEAWKIFCEKFGSDYQLVLVGKENYFYKNIKYKVESIKDVILTGYVVDSELVSLYQNASLYVFPSLYEGFGLPPLEAMVYDLPVVSSNASCLPEILGEGALYFDPENYLQMAEVIFKGLTDENLRVELKEKAKEELKRYSSDEFIKNILKIYLNKC